MGAKYIKFPAFIAISVPYNKWTQGLFLRTVLLSSISSTNKVPLWMISHKAAI
jgi:hypothetical protein